MTRTQVWKIFGKLNTHICYHNTSQVDSSHSSEESSRGPQTQHANDNDLDSEDDVLSHLPKPQYSTMSQSEKAMTGQISFDDITASLFLNFWNNARARLLVEISAARSSVFT